MKFARCPECGNTETFNTELSFCDGGGDGTRRHPRTRMVEVDQSQVLEQFGATEDASEDQRKQAAKDAESNLGLEEGYFAGVDTSDNEAGDATKGEGPGDQSVTDLFQDKGNPEAPHDPTNALPEGDQNTNTVSEENLAAQGWTRNENGSWNPPPSS